MRIHSVVGLVTNSSGEVYSISPADLRAHITSMIQGVASLFGIEDVNEMFDIVIEPDDYSRERQEDSLTDYGRQPLAAYDPLVYIDKYGDGITFGCTVRITRRSDGAEIDFLSDPRFSHLRSVPITATWVDGN